MYKNETIPAFVNKEHTHKCIRAFDNNTMTKTKSNKLEQLHLNIFYDTYLNLYTSTLHETIICLAYSCYECRIYNVHYLLTEEIKADFRFHVKTVIIITLQISFATNYFTSNIILANLHLVMFRTNEKEKCNFNRNR